MGEQCDDDRRHRSHQSDSSCPRWPGAWRGWDRWPRCVVFQQIFFPAPMGIVLNGALVGGRIALIALGIALVYRANRIVNFAQGDLGAVPAVLGVMLVVAWGWSYWFGLVVGPAGGGAAGRAGRGA